MASSNEDNEHLSWIEFCDKHAKTAATDFARALCGYVGGNFAENRGPSVAYKDFLSKFVDLFANHFEKEYSMNNQLRRVPNGNILPSAPSNHNSLHTLNHDEFSDYSEQEILPEIESPSPKVPYKPFYRRLSFKGLRKGKGFFHKQHSDEVELSHDKHSKNDKHSKTKLAKIVVECRKEGIVNYLMGENIDGCSNQKWEKCRLALVKTVGGYMLEFYSPPKVRVFFLRLQICHFLNLSKLSLLRVNLHNCTLSLFHCMNELFCSLSLFIFVKA